MTLGQEQVLEALEAAREKHLHRAGWLDLHRELLLVQWGLEQTLSPLVQPVTPERVNARREAQQPLFTFDELEVEWPAVRRLLRQVDEMAAQALPDWPPGTRIEMSEGSLRTWYAGQAPTDPRTAFLIGQTLRPFLHRAAVAARPHLAPDAYWRWGQCPVCGGEPDFSVLERESGARLLFCSRCDTDWRYKRIGCPFCDTENPGSLAYYPSDDGIYRLYVCDECGGYVKTMDLRQAFRPFVLQVERIVTIGMDLAAAEAGYRALLPAVRATHKGRVTNDRHD